MIRLDHTVFRELAGEPTSLSARRARAWYDRLGRAALLFLRPAILRHVLSCSGSLPVREQRLLASYVDAPSLPVSEGSTLPLFAWDRSLSADRPLDQSPLLPGFVLPLVWRRGSPDAHLPQSLHAVAATITESLELPSEWSLHRNQQVLGDIDLSRLHLACDSAWAALAGGLLLAHDGDRPQARVSASAAWSPRRGLHPVDGLPAKCEAAAAVGIRTLFVAERTDAPEEETAQAYVELAPLATSQSTPALALAPYLASLAETPRLHRGASHDQCVRHANRLRHAPRVQRESYLFANVTPGLVDRLDAEADLQHIDALVLLVSAPSAAALSLALCKPSHALLVTTTDYERLYATSQQLWPPDHIVPDGVTCQTVRVNADSYDSIAQTVGAFLAEHAARPTALDVTGGTKGMAGAAICAAVEQNALVYHIASNTGPGGHEAGTERPRMIRRGPS